MNLVRHRLITAQCSQYGSKAAEETSEYVQRRFMFYGNFQSLAYHSNKQSFVCHPNMHEGTLKDLIMTKLI